MNKKPKILIWDIENSHNLVLAFDLKNDQYIPHQNVVQERHLFCIGYKWLGEKQIHAISLLDDPKRFKKDVHDDYYVISEFRKVLETADAMVYHHGDKFDLPMFNARLAFHNLPPLPKIPSMDTKKVAWNTFRFNSNRLDYLAKFLGYEGKMANPASLWIEAWKGNEDAINHMVKYCKQDIKISEFVYERLLPFVTSPRFNMAAYVGGTACGHCGGRNLQMRGESVMISGVRYKRFQCQDCGRWGRINKSVKQDNPATSR